MNTTEQQSVGGRSPFQGWGASIFSYFLLTILLTVLAGIFLRAVGKLPNIIETIATSVSIVVLGGAGILGGIATLVAIIKTIVSRKDFFPTLWKKTNRPLVTMASISTVLLEMVIVLIGAPFATPYPPPGWKPILNDSFATPYPPPGWKLVLNDSLMADNGTWQESVTADGTCQFTANVYQVSVSKPNSGYGCFATTSNYTDFAFEVQMIIVKGDRGGITFRSNPDAKIGNEYYFRINRGGTYELDVYENYQLSTILKSDTSTAIRTGLNHPNTIAVVAQGNIITLYVNDQQIARVNDSTYYHGRIGFIADTNNTPPTEVYYGDAKVWTP